MIQNNLEHHHNVECQETLVSCTNHCEEFNQLSKPLKDLEKTACTVQPLGCPFFSIGCCIYCNTGFVCRNCFDAQVNDYSNLNI
jgi:hypothetical protein